jgi:6,7-dimethyl-8-ribityllumazine synthase
MKLAVKAKIGVVTSRFNPEITEKLEQGALSRLHELGVGRDGLVAVHVPGAYEIPLAAKWLLASGCEAVIALGAVIRGDTAHFDYVCSAVERGCTHLQLESGKPVVFGVLTTDTDEQALERVGGAHGHKGRDAADTAVEMLNLRDKLLTPVQQPKGGHT